MSRMYKEGDSWVVNFSSKGVHRQRSFKSKHLAEKVLGLFEGWKEIERAKEFIRFAIDDGLLNQEQKEAMERYITFQLCDLTELQKIQIKEIAGVYKRQRRTINCLKCQKQEWNYAKGLCRKCYMAKFEKQNPGRKSRRAKENNHATDTR